jgi:hypothetical protein
MIFHTSLNRCKIFLKIFPSNIICAKLQITVVKIFCCQFSSKICVFFNPTQFPILALFYKVSRNSFTLSDFSVPPRQFFKVANERTLVVDKLPDLLVSVVSLAQPVGFESAALKMPPLCLFSQNFSFRPCWNYYYLLPPNFKLNFCNVHIFEFSTKLNMLSWTCYHASTCQIL